MSSATGAGTLTWAATCRCSAWWITRSSAWRRRASLERVEAAFIAEQEAAMKMFAMLGFNQLIRLDDYVKDMQAIAHDYVLMGLDLRTDAEYAGVGG